MPWQDSPGTATRSKIGSWRARTVLPSQLLMVLTVHNHSVHGSPAPAVWTLRPELLNVGLHIREFRHDPLIRHRIIRENPEPGQRVPTFHNGGVCQQVPDAGRNVPDAPETTIIPGFRVRNVLEYVIFPVSRLDFTVGNTDDVYMNVPIRHELKILVLPPRM
jgi:hypothetical protein